MARLYGRIKHGLTPWRLKGSVSSLPYLLVFRSSIFTHWSEDWRAAEDWLADVEKKLISLKTRVKRGGDFDRWDIQVRNSLFSVSRALLTVEEHGGGKQMLKFRVKRIPTKTLILTMLVLVAIATFAAIDHAAGVATVFSSVAFVVFAAYLHDSASTIFDLKQAISSLDKIQSATQKVDTIVQPVAEEEISDTLLDKALEEARLALQNVSAEKPFDKELLNGSLTPKMVNGQLKS
jgi:hypothetical protein